MDGRTDGRMDGWMDGILPKIGSLLFIRDLPSFGVEWGAIHHEQEGCSATNMGR